MDAVRLSRIVTVGTIAIGGLALGHLLMPYAPPGTLGRRVAFWAAMLALGAFRGWRDGEVREVRGDARWRRIALTALASALVAFVAYWIAHGLPRGA